MRTFGLLLLALAAPAFGSPAVAADLPPQMPVKAPVIAPFTWAGPYAGVNFGYSWGDWDTTVVLPVAPGTLSLSPDVDGWLGGVQIGRNWQRDQWVFGLEADIQITGEDDGFPTGPVATAVTGGGANWDFPWFATLRARLGLAGGTEGRHLLYVTGGAAVGKVEFDYATTPAGLSAISGDDTEWGWTLGGGWEYAYDNNWSVKLEYLYIDLGAVNFSGTAGSTASIDVKDHVVRIGLNYRWGDRPVVTRY